MVNFHIFTDHHTNMEKCVTLGRYTVRQMDIEKEFF